MQSAGKLEYHVPACFTKERPSFISTHDQYHMSIMDHPVGSQMPRPSERPKVFPNPADFQSLARRPDTPKKLDDYLYSDWPQLTLHMVSFTDATLVTLTWGHWLLDAMGRAALIKAWISVLEGQEDLVPPIHGFDSDPLNALGSLAVEPYVLAPRQIVGFTLLIYLVRAIFDLLWHRAEENHVVCLPSSYIQSMKQTAMREIHEPVSIQADMYPSDSENKHPLFVSEGDIIVAWWTRLAIQHIPRNSTRSVTIANIFGLRSLLADDLLPSHSAFISNAYRSVATILPAATIYSAPLSFTAHAIRRSIQDQGTRAQIEAQAKQGRARLEKSGHPIIFGDSSTQLLPFSNWTKARFFDIDFSSAVLSQGPREKRMEKVGQPSYVQTSQHVITNRYTCIVMGKDAGGNYWLCESLRTSTWRKIEKDFEEM